VQEQPKLHPVEKELQDRPSCSEIQVKSAINEFEASRSALDEAINLAKDSIEGERPDRNVERREAELTCKRTTPRNLDVDNAVTNIGV
jgi:hypothetical protein